jgi:hypothetical protein
MERTPGWLVVILGLAALVGIAALQLLDDAEDAVPRSSASSTTAIALTLERVER